MLPTCRFDPGSSMFLCSFCWLNLGENGKPFVCRLFLSWQVGWQMACWSSSSNRNSLTPNAPTSSLPTSFPCHLPCQPLLPNLSLANHALPTQAERGKPRETKMMKQKQRNKRGKTKTKNSSQKKGVDFSHKNAHEKLQQQWRLPKWRN